MQELSQKKQEAFEIIKANYNKAEISKGSICVYDGSILHIVDENKSGIKVSSTLNMRYGVLLAFLIVTGIILGIIGIALTVLIANLAANKTKKIKKEKLITLIS